MPICNCTIHGDVPEQGSRCSFLVSGVTSVSFSEVQSLFPYAGRFHYRYKHEAFADFDFVWIDIKGCCSHYYHLVLTTYLLAQLLVYLPTNNSLTLLLTLEGDTIPITNNTVELQALVLDFNDDDSPGIFIQSRNQSINYSLSFAYTLSFNKQKRITTTRKKLVKC